MVGQQQLWLPKTGVPDACRHMQEGARLSGIAITMIHCWCLSDQGKRSTVLQRHPVVQLLLCCNVLTLLSRVAHTFVLWPNAEWNDLGCSRSGMPWLSSPRVTMAAQKGLEDEGSRLPVLLTTRGWNKFRH
jgi:hypothetical protein